MAPLFTVHDVVSFLTTRQQDDVKAKDGTADDEPSMLSTTLPVAPATAAASAAVLPPPPSAAATTTTTTTVLELTSPTPVQPSPFPLFDTDIQSNIPVKSDRAQSNLPVKLDRAQSILRPPLFPLFDTDTDDDNGDGTSDGSDDNGNDTSDGAVAGYSSGAASTSLPLHVTEQHSFTASEQDSCTGCADRLLHIQRAHVRMRQVISYNSLP